MYQKMKIEQAEAIADRLMLANDIGYSEVVIDHHWEADFVVFQTVATNGVVPGSTGMLRLYERIESEYTSMFVTSASIEVPVDKQKIAEAIMSHINGCIDEWIENDVVVRL